MEDQVNDKEYDVLNTSVSPTENHENPLDERKKFDVTNDEITRFPRKSKARSFSGVEGGWDIGEYNENKNSDDV